MCESVILSRKIRKNLFVPTINNRPFFRSENRAFNSKASEILRLFSQDSPGQNKVKIKEVNSATS